MSSKEMRARIIDSGSPRRWHSLNQVSLKHDEEGQRRAFGNDRKAERAHKRRMRLEEAQRQSLQNLQAEQIARALGKVMNGGGTPEDVDYVRRNIQRYERPIEGFNIRRISGNGETRTTKVTTAEVVVFDRRDKAISPEGNEL